MRRTLFVTATGTDIGKTYTTVGLIVHALAAGYSVTAVKPVASGVDPEDLAASDPGRLADALGLDPRADFARLCPWSFRAPLSPDMAAAREGRAIPFGEVVAFCRASADASGGLAIVEGVGGVLAPIAPGKTVRDLIEALAQTEPVDIVLVAGTYLGTISHTLTAIEALRARDLPAPGRRLTVVLSESQVSPVHPEETARTLSAFAPHVPILILPRTAAPWPAPAALAPILY